MKINFEIWWQRIIIVFIIALIFSFTMFLIKEKPFSQGEKEGGTSEEGNHYHPPGTPSHAD